MKLEFNDLSELDAFLHWAENYRSQPVQIVHVAGGSGGTFSHVFGGSGGGVGGAGQPTGDAARIVVHGYDTPPQGTSTFTQGDGSPADLEARDLKIGPYAGTDDKEAPAQPAAEPAKRKRRTKAEIEADEKAETARIAATKAAYEAAEACRAENFEEAGAAMKQAAQPAAEAAKQPEGTNPFEMVDNALSTPPADAQGDGAGESEVITPFQHLTRAREFIAKHGMPKYNETFAKAGLDANVMAYSAYQRAVHVAALDEMGKA